MTKPLLIVALTFSALSQASANDFFAEIDSRIKDVQKISDQRLVSERYYRLSARLSVYALYCDFKNELGYSLAFHHLWTRTADMQTQAEKTFGGFQSAYNKLEGQRNEESLRYVQMGNGVCLPSYPTFQRYVAMSASELRNALALPMPGDL
jgi:hypothetical protein